MILERVGRAFWLASCVDNDCKYRGKSTYAANYIIDCFLKIFGMLKFFFLTVSVIKTVSLSIQTNLILSPGLLCISRNLEEQLTAVINNKTHIVLHFKWKLFRCGAFSHHGV